MSTYKIWIEYEFTTKSQDNSLRQLTSKFNVNLNQYFPISTGSPIEVAFDSEYYQNQYEVKFKPFEPTAENIAAIQDWINQMHDELPIQNHWPSFVGTHIHIFREFPQVNPGYFHATSEVFKEIRDFMVEYAACPYIHKTVKETEFQRLLTSNNLLKFFDLNYLKNSFARIQYDLNSTPFQYRDIGIDRPKYKPCIWSPERQGKQKTFEIRYIPNSYFLLKDPQEIASFVDRINNILLSYTPENQIPKEPTLEELQTFTNSIINSYYDITRLYKSVSKDNSGLWNPEKEPLESSPNAWVSIPQDVLPALQNIEMSRISDDDLYRSTYWRSEESDDDNNDEWNDDDDDDEYNDDDN